MSAVRKGVDVFLLQVMLLLCAVLGSQQVVIKLAGHDISPVMQVLLRSLIAAFLVGAVVLWQGSWRGRLLSTWRAGAVVGSLFALEFLFIAESLNYTSASHVAVFLYTSPIFSALFLHFLVEHERLQPVQWLGIALCFAGLLCAFGVGADWSNLSAKIILGDSLALLAGLAWGLSTVAIRTSRLSEAPASLTLFYQLLMACVLLAAYVWLLAPQPEINWTLTALNALLFQGVVVAFLSYLLWFWLLRHYLASNIAVFSYLTPLYGVLFGIWLLGEALSLNFMLGAALVLCGVLLISSHSLFKRR